MLGTKYFPRDSKDVIIIPRVIKVNIIPRSFTKICTFTLPFDLCVSLHKFCILSPHRENPLRQFSLSAPPHVDSGVTGI